MRCGRWLRCATATAAAATATSNSTASGFQRLVLRRWQLAALPSSTAGQPSDALPPVVLYHGPQLGPRPLLILDHTLSSNADLESCQAAAAKFGPMLREANWEHGAVYIPLAVNLPVTELSEANATATQSSTQYSVLVQSSRQVIALLDVLQVSWTHLLAHGYGALVAAKLASLPGALHRVGTITLLDTPLVTAAMVRNAEQRALIAQAAQDVNVPAAELAFAKEQLCTHLEPALPCVADADAQLYSAHLFQPAFTFQANGLVRNDGRYLSVRALRAMRHPLQLIVPSAEARAEAAAHKSLFRLRRPAVVKAATSHAALFAEGSAKEVGQVVRSWLQRYEPDVFLKRRYEQAAKEMEQLLGSDAAAGTSSGGGGGAGGAGQRKPKDKKEKKEKKKKQKA